MVSVVAGSEPVSLSVSQDLGSTAKASECSIPAIVNMSAENNGSSEMGVGQPMSAGQKLLLPSIEPGGAPTFVGEKQYAAILRLRERRHRTKEARERELLKVKKDMHVPRGPKGRSVTAKGNQEGTSGVSMVESSPVPGGCYMHFLAPTGYQQVTTIDSEGQCHPAVGYYWPIVATNDGSDGEAQSSTPSAIGYYWAFVATNEGGEDVGDVGEVPISNTSSGSHQPTIVASEYVENIGELTYGSEAPFYPAGDSYWPVVATNDDEENVGEVAYNSILNLESPDPTSLLRIMMGNRYNTDEVSEQFKNVARLEAPGFASLLTVMNNAGDGYGKAVDHGHYDVEEVLTKLEGW
ncbi:hypothetical protein BS78_08G151800 [Paspalum vaginatum]|nr:hypothetical protein BS78_08G151800 [Paspalum vaginatum]